MKKGDKTIIVLLGVIIIGWILVDTIVLNNNNAEMVVEIKVNGDLVESIPLNEIKEEVKVVEINNQYGKNTILIDREGAEVVHADCPDQLCIKQGKITKPGVIIACLPNRLSVEIVSDREGELDATAQ